MSRPKKELQKRFVVFCEGDTEYNYIDKMRKQPGVQIVLKPINMKGGGYLNFLKKVKIESQSNCIAKFIIVDGDRLQIQGAEQQNFRALLEYCILQNNRGGIPHFLIVNNPTFEYVACLHFLEYRNQDVAAFLTDALGYKSIDQFKSKEDVYEVLNSKDRSYKLVVSRLAKCSSIVRNKYTVKKKSFDIAVKETTLDLDAGIKRCSNMDEFFDVVDW